MSTEPDEEFYGLAIKAASGTATPAEKAQLDTLLAAEPGRAAEFARVKANAEFAAKVVPVIYEQFVEVPPLPTSYREQFHQRVAEVFGPPQQTTQASVPKELNVKEMEALLIRIISERPSDGVELARVLERARFRLKGQGEGAIYGLLARLESSGYLEGRWRESSARMVKTYHATEKGSGMLERQKATASQLNVWAAAALAVDPSGS